MLKLISDISLVEILKHWINVLRFSIAVIYKPEWCVKGWTVWPVCPFDLYLNMTYMFVCLMYVIMAYMSLWPICHYDLHVTDLYVINTYMFVWRICHYELHFCVTYMSLWPKCLRPICHYDLHVIMSYISVWPVCFYDIHVFVTYMSFHAWPICWVWPLLVSLL